MNTKKVANEYRLTKWTQIIQERHHSGQTISDFCQEAGISKNTYFYWQRKVRKVACTELLRTQESKNIIPNGWMQLKPEQEQKEKATLDIEIFGFHVTVNAGTDPELLKKVCNILRSL
jgi:putative transposase